MCGKAPHPPNNCFPPFLVEIVTALLLATICALHGRQAFDFDDAAVGRK
jgi:hypothetical protein